MEKAMNGGHVCRGSLEGWTPMGTHVEHPQVKLKFRDYDEAGMPKEEIPIYWMPVEADLRTENEKRGGDWRDNPDAVIVRVLQSFGLFAAGSLFAVLLIKLVENV